MKMIHHSIIKKAQKQGIILEVKDNKFRAFWPQLNREALHATDPRQALRDISCILMTNTEYPSLKFTQTDKLGWECEIYNKDEVQHTTHCDTIKDAFIDALEWCQENDIDPSKDPNEPRGSVVDGSYKHRYRENGSGGIDCADWLAILLRGACQTVVDGKLKFDIFKFEGVCNANNVSITHLITSSKQSKNGWEGRARMSGSMALRRAIADAGVICIPEGATKLDEQTIEVPIEFCKTYATKRHKK